MSNKISISAIIISLVSLCGSVVCLIIAGNNAAAAPAAPAQSAVEESGTEQYVMYVGTND